MSTIKKEKGWAIYSEEKKCLMDDGEDDKKGNLLVFFPIFRRKKDAQTYKREAYGKWSGVKLTKVEICPQ